MLTLYALTNITPSSSGQIIKLDADEKRSAEIFRQMCEMKRQLNRGAVALPLGVCAATANTLTAMHKQNEIDEIADRLVEDISEHKIYMLSKNILCLPVQTAAASLQFTKGLVIYIPGRISKSCSKTGKIGRAHV